jgi:NAD(P)-dependent dehydrogenase (short-subunit alcohol dehydrogenase family)
VTGFTDQVGVVTGGAGGIGRAIGRRFGHEGMRVVLADVVPETLDEAVSQLRAEGLDVTGVATDVTDYSSVQRLVEKSLSHYGRIDIVCNNAGTGSVSEGYMWEHDLADWRWGIDVNVLGVIHGIKAFVPVLLEQGSGHVINTCSGNGGIAPIARGAMGGPAGAVYPLTKAAVLCLTESLYTHLEMAGGQVRAHVLFPSGFLNTGIWESWRHRPDRYAPSQTRKAPNQTLDAVVERFQDVGVPVQFTPLESVAEQVVNGLESDSFWMMGPPSASDEIALEKARSLVGRTPPTYLVDVLAKSAQSSAEGSSS